MRTKADILKMVVTLGIILFSLRATAQQEAPPPTPIEPSLGSSYRNAIGVRIGETSGFTYKHMGNNGNAFEGILSAYPYILGFTGLYEKHFSTKAKGLYWYVGGGGHANFGGPTTRVYYYAGDGRYYRYVYRSGAFALGLDMIGGVEYKFQKVPIALSSDLKPFIEWNDYGSTYYTIDPSIGVKFTF